MNKLEAWNEFNRKIFHGGITGVIAPILAIIIKNDLHLKVIGIMLYTTFLVLFGLLEYSLRAGHNWTIPFASYTYEKIAKDYEMENKTMIGGLYILLSGLFLISFLPRWAAILGIMIQAYSDSAAAIFGKGFPYNPLFYNSTKHYEGTIAFIITGFVVSLFCFYFVDLGWNYKILYSLFISILAGIIESLPARKYCLDNLSVPLISGLIAHLLIIL